MATQTVQAVDHKLLVARRVGRDGDWDEVVSPYDGTVVGRVAQGDAALGRPGGSAPAHEAFAPATSPSTSGRRCSTAPPGSSASGPRSWR